MSYHIEISERIFKKQNKTKLKYLEYNLLVVKSLVYYDSLAFRLKGLSNIVLCSVSPV